MNKSKIIMAGIGGAALTASLVTGWLVYSANSAKAELREEYEGLVSSAERLNSAKIAPSAESLKAIEANDKALKAWYDEAFQFVSAADLVADANVYRESFKQTMVNGARRLSKLPGEAEEGRLVKKNFNFGFPFITTATMPEQEKLVVYQRQWAEVYHFVEMIAQAGALELQNVTVAAPKPAVVEEKPSRGRGRGRDKAVEKKPLAAVETYTFKFTARAGALVRVLNAIAVEERFTTVDSLAFMRADDTLATILGAGKDKDAAGRKASRRRRPRRAQAETETAEGEEPKEENKKGLVTDPASVVPFTVELTISTYDFGTGTKSYSTLLKLSGDGDESEGEGLAADAEAEVAAETQEQEGDTPAAAAAGQADQAADKEVK